ncbi:MAG: glycosyltransferase family 2 protein [Pyrinomonadaceae bacterium]
MSSPILVSVIIPNYNKGHYLAEAINSALAQTYRDTEIIVIDDGSTDNSDEVLRSYGKQIKWFKQKNSGVSHARNRGIKESQGEYLAFLDSDDLWQPTKLEKQVALLDANSDIGLCYVGVERIDEDSKSLNYIEANAYPDYCEALLLYSCIVSGSCSSAMIRRRIINETNGFDTNFTNYEDWEFWLRLSLMTKFAPIPEFLVKYRVIKGSASFNNTKIIEQNVIDILTKFFSLPNLPEKYKAIKNKSYSNNWIILSGDYLYAGKYADSLRCLWNGFRLHPQNVVRPLRLPLRWTKRLLTGNV